MTELDRLEIIRQRLGGASFRAIARALRIESENRGGRDPRARAGPAGAPFGAAPRPGAPPRSSTPTTAQITALLARYPDITAVRLDEELRAAGFTGGHTIVKARLRALRPQPTQAPVIRFETGPGVQGQMDYSPFDIAFTEEGRRRVYAFSYILGVLAPPLPALRGGPGLHHHRARTRARLRVSGGRRHRVSLRQHEGRGADVGRRAAPLQPPVPRLRLPLWLPPVGLQAAPAQTKGKVEKPFFQIVTHLLNARTFASLAHLNAFVAETWLPQIDRRPHATTGRPPLELWEEERAHLVPLPAHAYDTAEVLYRTVGPEWHHPVQAEFLLRPLVPHRADPARAHHRDRADRVRPGAAWRSRATGWRRRAPASAVTLPEHAPGRDETRRHEQLAHRFAELGAEGPRFLEELVRTRRYGKDEAHRVLALLATYARADLVAALDRACRYRAFSLTAVERILAAQAQPKSALDVLDADARPLLAALMGEAPVPPRATAEYQHLLEAPDHGPQDEDPS